MRGDPSIETSLPPPAGTMVPQRVEELTPLWLTACLRHAGLLGAGRVVGFTQARIGQGKGFAGRLARIELEYDNPLPESPRRLVAKFASDQDAMRHMMGQVGSYRREVRFYRELANDVGVPTPRCVLAHYDEEGGRFLLLLEDMAPAASPGVERGLSLEQAREVMEHLAAFHAHRWDRTEGLDWLELDDATIVAVRDQYLVCLPTFVERRAEQYPVIARVARAIGEMFATDEWIDKARAGPRVLTHNDLHVENTFFPTEAGGRFALIDWQGVAFQRHGIGDVTRIVCMGLEPELRRAHTDALLRHYHARLLALGVRGYSFKQLKLRFREEMIAMVVVGVLALGTIDFEDEEGGERAAVVVGDRIEAALRDARVTTPLAMFMWGVRLSRGLRRLVGLGPAKRLG